MALLNSKEKARQIVISRKHPKSADLRHGCTRIIVYISDHHQNLINLFLVKISSIFNNPSDEEVINKLCQKQNLLGRKNNN